MIKKTIPWYLLYFRLIRYFVKLNINWVHVE
jgi:hypothetical protein